MPPRGRGMRHLLALTVFLRKREPNSIQLFLPQDPRYRSSSPLRLSCPLAPACGNDPAADIIASCRRPSERETPSLPPCRTGTAARPTAASSEVSAALAAVSSASASVCIGLGAWPPRSPPPPPPCAPWSVSVPDSRGSMKAWPLSSRVQMRARLLQIFHGAGSQRQWSPVSPDPGPRKSQKCRAIAMVPQNGLCRAHAAHGFRPSEQEKGGEEPGLGVHAEPRAWVGL